MNEASSGAACETIRAHRRSDSSTANGQRDDERIVFISDAGASCHLLIPPYTRSSTANTNRMQHPHLHRGPGWRSSTAASTTNIA